jgi:hypothetical protein
MNLTGQPVYAKGQKRKARSRPPSPASSGNSELEQLARKKGTDKQFRDWIQSQPSCLTGQFSEWTEKGWRNPACHVRRAGESGTGHKAEYACIPMTHAEHRIQHQRGEILVLMAYLGKEWDREKAREWFDRKRIDYLQRWLTS